jgi:tripartite-type tricarboxylate transporter receptor subunit TctC
MLLCSRRAVVAAVLAAAVSTPAFAQSYPAGKPIEMTVMFGAGSASDITARQLAEGMAKALGAPVPVVNRTGAGGAVGYLHVSQQKPDGYAIVWNSNSISTTFHSGQLPFDYKNFEPVARVTIENPALAVKATSQFKTLKDLITFAKANPEKVRVGNSGAGSHTHIVAEALFHSAGAKITSVPFGTGQATVNLLGDRIEAAVQFPQAFLPHVKSGDLRVLAMPKAVIQKLQDAVKKTVESPEFIEAGKKIGFTPAYQGADAFGKMIAEDDARLAAVMKEIGLKKNN